MTDHTPRRDQLPPGRVEEIRELHARLLHPDPGEVLALLAECRTALEDLLTDRDDLVAANAETGEQLAAWLGHI